MELIYLWVEDYKNIHKQGFNFSPKFTCDYDEKTNELSINENDNYIPDFFGKNINLTAIVGKNGSGKSSILDVLASKSKNSMNIESFLIIEKDSNIECFSCFKDFKINNFTKKDFNFIKAIENLNYKVYANEQIDYEYSQISLNKEEILYLLLNKNVKNKFKISTFMYIPGIIEIKLNLDEELQEAINTYLDRAPQQGLLSDINDNEIINSSYNDFISLRNKTNYHKFLVIWYVGSQGHDKYTTYNLCDIDLLIQKYNQYCKDAILIEKDIEEYFLENITKDINTLTNKEKLIYIENYSYCFKIDLLDIKNRRYNNLSHGERLIFGQLLNIYCILLDKNYNNLVLIFDEPDIALHPNWQKKYLNEIICLSKRINKKFHFIFTTHSPFLLSDLPKENVIFLDTYKKEDEEVKSEEQDDGNCKNVTKTTDINPFGANIHTLLSDGFFMEGGLMGEFAKGKIEKIKKFYEKVIKYQNKLKIKKAYLCFYIKKSDKFWQIQDIIGEPFLKKIVKNQLEEIELILLGKDEAIDNEIARLQALKVSSKNA